MNENIRSIEQNLKVLRVLHDLRQADVAEKLGISQQMYSFIETGQRQPSVQVAKRIAAVLGFDWTRFFEDQEKAEDSA